MKKYFLSLVFLLCLVSTSFSQNNSRMVDKRVKQCINDQKSELDPNFSFNYWVRKYKETALKLAAGAKNGSMILFVVEARKTIATLTKMSDNCATLGKIKQNLVAMEATYKKHLTTEEFKGNSNDMFSDDTEKNYFITRPGAKELAKQCKKIMKILSL